jgi:hypothetical protein
MCKQVIEITIGTFLSQCTRYLHLFSPTAHLYLRRSYALRYVLVQLILKLNTHREYSDLVKLNNKIYGKVIRINAETDPLTLSST